METQKGIVKITVHAIHEIEPVYVMRAPSQLSIKVSIDPHQMSELILNSLNDFSIEQLNEIFNRDGLSLILNEETK